MPDTPCLRDDALAIWRAGVDAVRSETLVKNVIRRDGNRLTICDQVFDLGRVGRIAVVGAGKAGAGMAAAVEAALGADLDDRLDGWINVPADCIRPLRKIRLHAARDAGVNEPSEAGVAGAIKILEIVAALGSNDLCLVLISGGGSALLPSPAPGITLADKLAVTRFLMQSGATIHELNAVRTPLSRIKGGGLARAIQAGNTITLVISDVIGDPLEVIASGPTVVSDSNPARALEVLRRFGAAPQTVPRAIFDFLSGAHGDSPAAAPRSTIRNHIIGNNAMALAAAERRARELGYPTTVQQASNTSEEATAYGRNLAERCLALRNTQPPGTRHCLIEGGEPVVRLSKATRRGKGGRNQQVVLAAVDRLWNEQANGIVILSGGTDGEDGPTDAAGAFADAELIRQARLAGEQPTPFLDRNDAYNFFEPLGGLIITGPTHTNVMDVRVALVATPAR
jgi:glycerate 2-kinase